MFPYTSGEVQKPCTLSLIDDELYEDGEELRLVLGNPKSDSQFGASVGSLNEAVVIIRDTADSESNQSRELEGHLIYRLRHILIFLSVIRNICLKQPTSREDTCFRNKSMMIIQIIQFQH